MSRRHLLLWAAAILTAAGCGGPAPRGVVRGRVTLGADSVAPAVIFFENAAAGVGATASVRDDGTYEVASHQGAGLPPGVYRVAVTPGGMLTDQGDIVLAGKAPPPPRKQPPPKIPARFHSTATSKLEVTVKDGDNPPFDFDLAAAGK